MKKLATILAAGLMAVSFAACSSSAYKDGTFYAEADEFSDSGWKDNVTVTVSGGKITEVNWNATNKDGGNDKKTASQNGEYGMKEKGNSIAEWHEEAAVMEDELVKLQDPSKIKVTSDGYADGISGATIHVSDFVNLSTKALVGAK